MNAVVIAVAVMLLLALLRVHVVIALFIGALVGGLMAGMGLESTMVAFQTGLGDGAKIALSYALLGAFAMAVAASGLPKALADALIRKLDANAEGASQKVVTATSYLLIAGILAMSIMSQNLIPVHIAFIPLLIPPLLTVMNRLEIDRRLIACVLTFGLVTTYMTLPVGFGKIFLEDILLGNIERAGLDTSGINIVQAMAIPALGMTLGLLVAVFVTYRKPRSYTDRPIAGGKIVEPTPTRYNLVMSLIAIVATFAIQLIVQFSGSEADGLLLGSLVGLGIFLISGVVEWN
ncbi:MAG TPA: Na+/H+ antiporter NhaC family protein, partial [Yaniella sp.]